MIEGLFDIKLNNNDKISISANEIYNEFLLYIFLSFKKNVVLVTPSLNEANRIYLDLSQRGYSNVYIFPDDDLLTKKAIATSPELMYMRLRFLNNLSSKNNLLICHTNSFLKKLPSRNDLNNKNIKISIGSKLDRDKFVDKLLKIGYRRESIATNTGEFSIRGFVVDVFPIFEEHPVRIEFFDDEVEKVRYFDENTQLSLNDVKEITIKPVNDEYDNASSNVLSYLKDPILIYQDYNQILNVQKSIDEQMKYYDEESTLFNIKDIKNDFTLYLDTINNDDKFDHIIKAESIPSFNNNFDNYCNSVISSNSFLCTRDNEFVKKVGISKTRVINQDISSGFVFNGVKYFSKNDLTGYKPKLNYNTGLKIGKKITSIDKLEVGDYVVHKVNGIGVYAGITTIMKNGIEKDYILINYKGDDKLYLPVDKIDKLYKYSSKDGAKPNIYKLNSTEWQKTKSKIKSKIKDISDKLINLYKNRQISTITPFEPDTPEQAVYESEFIYEETPDQLKVTNEIKRDLESSKPMDRLLCGDVGYGKTEVIFRAIFKAVMNGVQVAYLCPTTLLSYQQYVSAVERFKNFGLNIALLNRYTTRKETKEILEKLENGLVDVVFGTHRLLSGDIKFKNLGLLIIDEEQRFGVLHKERIKEMKTNVHVLSVSATPIPRSLQMSLVGIRDMSLIETPPKAKLPIQTYVINYDPYLLREVVLKEKARNGQVFILYNKVEDMEKVVNDFKKLIPEVSIIYAHGKMNKEDMQDVIYKFNQNEADVLICTTIIENGIDIPNANTMIVMDADRFGLSQLYQIRGRVGRGDRQAYAYLMYNKDKILGDTAVKRLDAIKEFTSLGSGYNIAIRDLSIRGAGDLLGSEQAGFIDSVGTDMYLELINEELNGTSDEKENEITIDDVDNHIGEEYSDETGIIIDLHQKVASINSVSELNEVYQEIEDRFGHVDEKLKVYMYQELTEKLLSNAGIKILINNSQKIALKLDESVFKKLNIEKLFIESTRISTKFNFVYRASHIEISLNKINLDKHYIYYLFDLAKYISSNII